MIPMGQLNRKERLLNKLTIVSGIGMFALTVVGWNYCYTTMDFIICTAFIPTGIMLIAIGKALNNDG